MIQFIGSVSGQRANRPVQIQIAQPDGTTKFIDTTTDSTLAFKADFTPTQAGTHKAKAVAWRETGYFQKGESPLVEFQGEETPTIVKLDVVN